MNTEMRRALAQESFEEKIRKVSELIRLSHKIKTQGVRQDSPDYAQSVESGTPLKKSKK